jgi:molecular chaperone DnaJ
MTDLCYYEVLEIEKSADKSTIKKAYRKMAMKYHPDKNPGDKKAEDNFKIVNEAYQILSDDQKRQIYDQYGKEGLEGRGQGFSGFEDLGSIFEEMFGGGFSGQRQSRQRKTYNYDLDNQIHLSINFNEAVFGCKKTINLKYKTACKSCKGTGAKNGKLAACSTCDGQGQIHMRQGFMTFAQTCPHCSGTGRGIKDKCQDCSGLGYKQEQEKFEVNIPEGINNENRIRISSKGNIAPNKTRGDLYIQIKVLDDKYFVRHDDDVYLEVPIFFTQIALGTTIMVPGLRGKVELKIPMGTKDKEQFVFKRDGIKNVNGRGYGNFVVQIKIQYPKSMNNEQQLLLKKLQDSFGVISKPHENSFSGIFDKVKGWFS